MRSSHKGFAFTTASCLCYGRQMASVVTARLGPGEASKAGSYSRPLRCLVQQRSASHTHIGTHTQSTTNTPHPRSSLPSQNQPNQVLKWSKPLPGARATFQREWMLGRRLNAAARQDPALDLLLQTGAFVCASVHCQSTEFTV